MVYDIFPVVTPAEHILSNYKVCHTSDISEAILAGERLFCKNDIYSRDGKLNTTFYYRQLNGVGVGRITYGGEAIISPDVMESFLLIQIPIRGSEFIESDDRRVLFKEQQGVILNAHARTRIHHNGDTEKIIIRVDNEMVMRMCQQHLGRTLRKSVEFKVEMALDRPESRGMRQVLAWICDLLSNTDSLPPLLNAQISTSIVNMLLSSQPNNYSSELHEDKTKSIAPAFVKKIERYIEDHADEPLSIGDFSEYAGVSTRSLFSGFRQFRNTSPMNYLKEIRLRRVREELIRTPPSSGIVTTIALRWGFSHLGHFTTDYKRRFGETPSETLIRS